MTTTTVDGSVVLVSRRVTQLGTRAGAEGTAERPARRRRPNRTVRRASRTASCPRRDGFCVTQVACQYGRVPVHCSFWRLQRKQTQVLETWRKRRDRSTFDRPRIPNVRAAEVAPSPSFPTPARGHACTHATSPLTAHPLASRPDVFVLFLGGERSGLLA